MSSLPRPSFDFYTAAARHNEEYLIHDVKSSDTLAGIAIRYSVPVEDIKRVNSLFSEMIHGHLTLKIPLGRRQILAPVTVEQEQRIAEERRMVRQFAQQVLCPAEDARFFLTKSDWDYESAIKAYRDANPESGRKVPQVYDDQPVIMLPPREPYEVDGFSDTTSRMPWSADLSPSPPKHRHHHKHRHHRRSKHDRSTSTSTDSDEEGSTVDIRDVTITQVVSQVQPRAISGHAVLAHIDNVTQAKLRRDDDDFFEL
eukprot:TRINITY_DN3493_c0_g1_i1.p1 TRINITY_DN3493_c0_g1~~TRINITY_DN3493_c0_g1_i1.p1  ORF type:complete len:256 (+),score=38.50 TRINITY_DN3493_c0_g1_i1:348-1115(+)